MFYDDKQSAVIEETNELTPITTRGMFIIIILLGVSLVLLCNILYSDDVVNLSAVALRSCAGCQ